MASKIKLTRKPLGSFYGTARPLYEAMVVAKGFGGEPKLAQVIGPDADKPELYELGIRWIVEVDVERSFRSFKDARAYLDRFFEAA